MYSEYSVLFVDDEINVLNSLRRGLIDETYQCFFANSGEEALDIMKQETIAVIVTDMKMPGMDGLQLLKIVQGLYPNTISIILSGYTQLQQILTTINQVQIFRFITKPWRLEDEFIGAIQKALEYYILREQERKLEKKLESQNQVYQGILSRIDTTIQSALRSTQLLADIGSELLKFNVHFYAQVKNHDDQIFALENTIFNTLKSEVMYTIDRKDCSSIFEEIYKSVTKAFDFEIIKKRVKQDFEDKKVETYWHVGIGIIKSVISVFFAEYSEYELSYIEGLNREGHMTISLVSQDFFEIPESKNKEKIELLNIKMLLLENVFSQITSNTYIKFGNTSLNGKRIFVVTLTG